MTTQQQTDVTIDRIGELVADALQGKLDGASMREAIGDLLDVPPAFVNLNFEIDARTGIELTITVPTT